MLCIGVVLIVMIFRSSNALAAAYGIAVTGVMAISTLLVAIVARRQWRWNMPAVIGLFGTLGIHRPRLPGVERAQGRRGAVGCRCSWRQASSWSWTRGGWAARASGEGQGFVAAIAAVPRPRRQDPASRRGHRRVPRAASRRGTQRIAAQHEALQGAARTHRAGQRHRRGHALRAREPARRGREARQGFLRGAHPLRFLRRTSMCPRRCRRRARRAWSSTWIRPRSSSAARRWSRASTPGLKHWRIGLYTWLASNALAPSALLPPAPQTASSSWVRRSRFEAPKLTLPQGEGSVED